MMLLSGKEVIPGQRVLGDRMIEGYCGSVTEANGGVMETKEELLYYEQFYRDTKPAVEHYLMMLLHNYSVIEDVSQEVYLEAYRKLDVLMQHPEPRGFLFRMARYKALHWMRDRNRIENEEYLCDDEVLMTKASDEDEFKAAEVRLTIKKLLTEEEYRLFDAHYVQGYTEKEIAANKHKSHAAVRMSCSRMTRKLREKMVDNGEWAS